MDARTDAPWGRARTRILMFLAALVICLALLMIWQGAEQDFHEAAVSGDLR